VKFLEDKKDKLSGADAYRLVYASRQKKADFKFLQVMCIRDNRAYVLTYTALQTQYDKLLKTAQAIIKSFQLTAK
ncbi:MAG: PsbP-related protein, partial [Candidatus Omnitrophota bacterium]